MILAGRDSQAQIVEVYEGSDGAGYFTNTVTEIDAADGSVVAHSRVQRELETSLHFGMLAVRQGGSSNFASHNIALGAALARNEIAVVLDGEGSECTLNGLYVTTGRQHVDNYTTSITPSRIRPATSFIRVFSTASHRAFFTGASSCVRTRRRRTRSSGTRICCSRRARSINTKPQLEIYADDVKCTHGATVGQVDPDAVFYFARAASRSERRGRC